MDLSRSVHRNLADGRELVVTRHYRVTFHPNAQGFLIEGQWRGTDVDAPPRLAGLADMEKARADNATFPMQLDRAGMILSLEPGEHPALSQSEAQAAGRLIAGAGLNPLARQQAARFLEQLAQQQGPTISQWPVALFRPGSLDAETQQELVLPQGQSGQATIAVSARSAQPCGVMQQMERKVRTVIAGQMRETREIWTLNPAKE